MRSRTASCFQSPVPFGGQAVLVALLATPAWALEPLAPAAGAAELPNSSPAGQPTDAASGLRVTPQLRAGYEIPGKASAVTLFVFDVQGLVGSDLPTLAAEADAIFAEAGVELGWRSARLGTVFGEGAGREIPVILVDKPRNPKAVRPDVLGLVPKDARTAVWVFLDHVRRAAGIRNGDDSRTASRTLAVATGRVVAHELVHALVPALRHTKYGLMSSSLDPIALSGPRRPALGDCVSPLRAALAPALPPPPFTPAAAGLRFQLAY